MNSVKKINGAETDQLVLCGCVSIKDLLLPVIAQYDFNDHLSSLISGISIP
jgi:hypothetical protein